LLEQARRELLEPPREIDDQLRALIDEPLSQAIQKAGLSEPRKVVGLKMTDAGLEVSLEDAAGEIESVLVPPDDKVMRVLTARELQQAMTVNLTIAKQTDGEIVEQITVF